MNNVSVDLGGGGGGGGRGHDQKNKLEAISCVCAGVSNIHEAKSRTKTHAQSVFFRTNLRT